MQTLLNIYYYAYRCVFLVATLLMVSAAQAEYPPVEYTQDGCQVIKYIHSFHQIKESTSQPGRYCLGQDFIQRKGYDLIDGRDRGDPKQGGIISIGASDTELNMGGHLLSGKPYDNVLGIKTWWPDPRNYNQPLNTNPTPLLAHLHIHHGRIEVKGAGGVGMDLAFAGMSIDFNDKLSHDSVSKDPSKIGVLPEENTFDLRLAKIKIQRTLFARKLPVWPHRQLSQYTTCH